MEKDLRTAAEQSVLQTASEQSKIKTAAARIKTVLAPVSHAIGRADDYVFSHPWQVILLCLAVMVLTTAVKFRVFDPAQFYDANAILAAVAAGTDGIDRAFSMIIAFFRVLSAPFGALSLPAWGWLLLVPGAAMFAVIVKKAPPQSLMAFFLLLAFSVLLPFYVFTVGKDFLQHLIFFLMAIALLYLPKEPMKLLGGLVLVLITAVFFRYYYVLMFGLSLGLYGVALLYRRQKSISRQAIFLMVLFCLVVLALFFMRAVLPEATDDLFTVRTATNQYLGATAASDKAILDLLPLERSVPGFLANYITAAIRMMFPVELCASLGDIPFAVFQTLCTVLLFHEFLKSRRAKARTSVYALIIAFYLMSFFFEPDFGSWFRHESAAFPLIWLGIGADEKTRRGRSHGISA